MYALDYRVTLLSPTIVTSYSSDENMVRTLDYIPGSSVLGLFASKYIRQKGITEAHEDEVFYNWFLRGDIKFLNGYILIEDEYDTWNTLPIPLSIQKEKTGNKIVNVSRKDTRDIQTKRLNGYGRFNSTYVSVADLKKKINFHHARSSRLKGISDDGNIFNYEYLMPGQKFQGHIKGSREVLQNFKDMFGDHILGRIGKSKGAEYGQVEIELTDIYELEFDTDILNNSLWEKERSVFITFISPCIILNKFGTSDPSLYNLNCYLKKVFGPNIDFTVENSVINPIFIENYLAVWNMKRPTEYAIDCGSTIKIKFKDFTEEDLIDALLRLENEGLGRRKNEGFGQIKINIAPYEEYIESTNKIEIQKPAGYVPNIVKEIFMSAIEDGIIELAKKEALLDIEDYYSYPKNALLSRLRLILNISSSEKFSDEVKKFSKPAVMQLKACINETGVTLYQTFTKDSIKIVDYILGNKTAVQDQLIREIGLEDLYEDAELRDKICRTYYVTLIDQMRQKNKKGEVGQVESYKG